METGRSYADEWALKITDVERNDWLRKNNITVYALRGANPADVFVREITMPGEHDDAATSAAALAFPAGRVHRFSIRSAGDIQVGIRLGALAGWHR